MGWQTILRQQAAGRKIAAQLRKKRARLHGAWLLIITLPALVGAFGG